MGESPKKPEVRLEGWRKDRPSHTMIGTVFGHPRISDGSIVRTSTIVEEPLIMEPGSKVETRNTIYTLGEAMQEGSADGDL